MSDVNDREYNNLLIVNESNDAKVTLYIYLPRLPFSVTSKIIQPNEKYLHREKRMFRFKLVANFDDQREKKEFPGPLEWVTDTLIRITISLECIEENLADYPLEKRICLRKMHLKNEIPNTSGKLNLYSILDLNMEYVRKLDKDDQKKAIKKAFNEKMKIWHPDKNFGDGEIAVQIIVAKETLLDDERRARYHNEADYDKGWFSLKRYKAIFWPECYTEEPEEGEDSETTVEEDHISEGAAEKQKATFTYKSDGAWISKMIITYSFYGEEIKKEVIESGTIVKIPADARQIEVRFQVWRPCWGDIMKYDRFKKTWCKPYEPHVFRYETPPLRRTFTISGNLWWEAVMRVSDEYHEETGEMVGYTFNRRM